MWAFVLSFREFNPLEGSVFIHLRKRKLAGVPINGGALTQCGEIPFHRQNRD